MSLLEPSASLQVFVAGILLASLLMFLVGGYVGVLRQRTGASAPEANWRIWPSPYTASSLHQYLLGAGGDGWHVYRVALWWDVLFSANFAVMGFILANGLWGAADGVDGWLLLGVRILPLGGGAVDIIEDFLLLGGIGTVRVPAGSDLSGSGLISAAGWCTRVKFLLYGLALVALPVGAGVLVARGRS